MWHKMSEQPPPKEPELAWYKIRYNDGREGEACWWANHWYCNVDWTNIVEWYEEVSE